MPRGITPVQTGIIGAVFVISGIAGAIVLPIISDTVRIRIRFFITAITLLVPLYLGFTFLDGFIPLAVTAGLAGFTIMGVCSDSVPARSRGGFPCSGGNVSRTDPVDGQISGIALVYLVDTVQGLTDLSSVDAWHCSHYRSRFPLTLRMRESNYMLKNSVPEPGYSDKTAERNSAINEED